MLYKSNFYLKYKNLFIFNILILSVVILSIQLIIEQFFSKNILIILMILSTLAYTITLHYYFVRDSVRTSLYIAYASFFAILLLFFSGSYIITSSYLWTLLFPIVFYSLLGLKKGNRWIISLITIISGFILLILLNLVPKVLDFYILIQTYLALISFSFITHFFEKMTFHTYIDEKEEDKNEMIQFKKRIELALLGNHAGAYEWNLLDNSAYISPQWKDMLGYHENTIFPENLDTWKKRVHPDDIEEVISTAQNILEEKKSRIETTHRLQHKNGNYIWILDRGYVQYDNEGNPYRITGIHTDITEKKQFENELEKAKEIAEESTRIKNCFLASMSHEIRTPLNAINGFTQILMEREKNIKNIEYLEVINNSSDTLLHTINNILDLSQIENEDFHISRINFHPDKEIISTIKLFQSQVDEKKITLTTHYSEDIPKVLYNDIVHIKRIITNLLSNAIKFTSHGGYIIISIMYHAGELIISIQDTGIGIAQNKLEYIFESFSQVDNSKIREFSGNGLGLTISKKIINMLDGTLTVKSKLGEGSKFSFSIPTKEGEIKNDKILPSTTLNGKILLVEDIITNQMLIGLILKQSGLTYDIANNGIEAVNMFEKYHYDIILMDENMPLLNGMGATQKIRNIETIESMKSIPIIALTANALSGDKEKFIQSGMNDYLSKPIDPNTLIKTLSKYLHK